MSSVSAAFAFMLIVAMAAAYPVHKAKVTNQDLIKTIKDGNLQQIVYYWWGQIPASETKKGSAMRDNSEDNLQPLQEKKLHYYWAPPSKKKGPAMTANDEDSKIAYSYQNAMRDDGYEKVKPRNIMD